ncbi:MAG TPA: proteasome activator [Methylomirabilota bacterium]|nr:proteasome activator [Methylomirabilota bacterium]
MTDRERGSHAAVTSARESELESATAAATAAEAGTSPDIQRPGQLIRIASMVRELQGEVRQSSPDDAGRKRLREVYDRALAELRDTLSGPLQQELDTLTIPLEGTPSESEIRIAQAQLVGWLEGLFQGIQAAVWAQQMQAQNQLEEMRRRGLPRIAGEDGRVGANPGQYL